MVTFLCAVNINEKVCSKVMFEAAVSNVSKQPKQFLLKFKM